MTSKWQPTPNIALYSQIWGRILNLDWKPILDWIDDSIQIGPKRHSEPVSAQAMLGLKLNPGPIQARKVSQQNVGLQGAIQLGLLHLLWLH
jgi:hypothetical protein